MGHGMTGAGTGKGSVELLTQGQTVLKWWANALLGKDKDEALGVLKGDSMEIAACDAKDDLLDIRKKTKSAISALEAEYDACIHAVNCYEKDNTDREFREILKVINDPAYTQTIQTTLHRHRESGVNTIDVPMVMRELARKYQMAIGRS